MGKSINRNKRSALITRLKLRSVNFKRTSRLLTAKLSLGFKKRPLGRCRSILVSLKQYLRLALIQYPPNKTNLMQGLSLIRFSMITSRMWELRDALIERTIITYSMSRWFYMPNRQANKCSLLSWQTQTKTRSSCIHWIAQRLIFTF